MAGTPKGIELVLVTSISSEVVNDGSRVLWENIAGLNVTKQALEKAVFSSRQC